MFQVLSALTYDFSTVALVSTCWGWSLFSLWCQKTGSDNSEGEKVQKRRKCDRGRGVKNRSILGKTGRVVQYAQRCWWSQTVRLSGLLDLVFVRPDGLKLFLLSGKNTCSAFCKLPFLQSLPLGFISLSALRPERYDDTWECLKVRSSCSSPLSEPRGWQNKKSSPLIRSNTSE